MNQQDPLKQYVPPTQEQVVHLCKQRDGALAIISSFLGALNNGKIKAPGVLITSKDATEYRMLSYYESVREDLEKIGIKVPAQTGPEPKKKPKRKATIPLPSTAGGAR